VLAAGVAFFFLASDNTTDDEKNNPPKTEEKIEKEEKVRPKDTIKTTAPKTKKDRTGRKQPIERVR
jgi:hypothetical protein